MDKVDWSKAPEWATHYHPENNQFYVAAGGKDFHIAGHEDYGRVMVNAAWIAGLVQRPVAWTGAGLPPVGATCLLSGETEFFKPIHPEWAGREVKIYAHFTVDSGTELAAYVGTDGVIGGVGIDLLFVPIRTPEQIAAEARENAITEMLNHSSLRARDGARSVFGELYDAGYRKVEGGAE